MSVFIFEKLDIEGAYLITSQFSEDIRGSFTKYFEINVFQQNGIDFSGSEFFISVSKENVVRGMHFQLNHPQIKFVSVFAGKIFDVIVDLRKNSRTFGQWRGYYLSADNHRNLLVPRGCAHGFAAVAGNCLVSYCCDGKYDKTTDVGIRFDDPDIGIEWPISLQKSIVSDRDKKLMSFSKFKDNYHFDF